MNKSNSSKGAFYSLISPEKRAKKTQLINQESAQKQSQQEPTQIQEQFNLSSDAMDTINKQMIFHKSVAEVRRNSQELGIRMKPDHLKNVESKVQVHFKEREGQNRVSTPEALKSKNLRVQEKEIAEKKKKQQEQKRRQQQKQTLQNGLLSPLRAKNDQVLDQQEESQKDMFRVTMITDQDSLNMRVTQTSVFSANRLDEGDNPFSPGKDFSQTTKFESPMRQTPQKETQQKGAKIQGNKKLDKQNQLVNVQQEQLRNQEEVKETKGAQVYQRGKSSKSKVQASSSGFTQIATQQSREQDLTPINNLQAQNSINSNQNAQVQNTTNQNKDNQNEQRNAQNNSEINQNDKIKNSKSVHEQRGKSAIQNQKSKKIKEESKGTQKKQIIQDEPQIEEINQKQPSITSQQAKRLSMDITKKTGQLKAQNDSQIEQVNQQSKQTSLQATQQQSKRLSMDARLKEAPKQQNQQHLSVVEEKSGETLITRSISRERKEHYKEATEAYLSKFRKDIQNNEDDESQEIVVSTKQNPSKQKKKKSNVYGFEQNGYVRKFEPLKSNKTAQINEMQQQQLEEQMRLQQQEEQMRQQQLEEEQRQQQLLEEARLEQERLLQEQKMRDEHSARLKKEKSSTGQNQNRLDKKQQNDRLNRNTNKQSASIQNNPNNSKKQAKSARQGNQAQLSKQSIEQQNKEEEDIVNERAQNIKEEAKNRSDNKVRRIESRDFADQSQKSQQNNEMAELRQSQISEQQEEDTIASKKTKTQDKWMRKGTSPTKRLIEMKQGTWQQSSSNQQDDTYNLKYQVSPSKQCTVEPTQGKMKYDKKSLNNIQNEEIKYREQTMTNEMEQEKNKRNKSYKDKYSKRAQVTEKTTHRESYVKQMVPIEQIESEFKRFKSPDGRGQEKRSKAGGWFSCETCTIASARVTELSINNK